MGKVPECLMRLAREGNHEEMFRLNRLQWADPAAYWKEIEQLESAAAADPLEATLAVLSPVLAKMVKFIASQPEKRAHVDEVSRRLDGITKPGSVFARRKTVRTRFERARDKMDDETTPFVLAIDNWVMFLKPRT